MKKIAGAMGCRLLAVLLAGLLLACSPAGAPEQPVRLSFTDALGYPVELERWDRVVSLYGSFAETWMLAGGTLVGATSDAVEERGLALDGQAAVVGSVKHPNFEEILAADPDFVMLSADIASHADLHGALVEAGIGHAYYRVDSFSEYLAMLEQFCAMTGRMDLYAQNGLAVQERIDRVLELTAGRKGPSVLLLRAFSTGAKAKGADNLAGAMLADLGADNLASRYDSLLEEVSLEAVIAADPDFIFVVAMGANEESAMEYMARHFEENPAWAQLTAVKNGRYVLLPQEMFHYKPNARWGESYETLAKILYPDLAAQIG